MTVLDDTHTAPDLRPLSAAMREGSQAEHEAAESSRFMSELLGGQVAGAGYLAYLRRLRLVYVALEEVGREQAADPVVAAVHDPTLERLAAIDGDLAFWAGACGEPVDSPVDSPAADGYHQRLRDSAAWGGLYAAHHYTRYLGDLSGGQAIGRSLDRTFALGGQGTSFYRFAEIPKPKPYKDAYRARLDALGLTPDLVGEVVEEVKVAFGLNQALFAELDTHLDRWRR